VDRNPSGDPIASIKCGTIIGPVTAIVAAIAIRIGWVGIAVGIGWVPIAVGIGGIAVAIVIGWVVAIRVGRTR
jgi:hypothetical protein